MRKSAAGGRRSYPDVLVTKTQQERARDFVVEYKKTGDIAEACGLSGLSNGRAKMLIETHPELREDISLLLAKCGVTPELVITELRRIASYDPKQMLDANGNVLPMQQWPEDLTRAVSGMDVSRREYRDDSTETTHKPRFADKLGPLKELARMSALASDRVEIANAPGQKFGITNDAPAETKDQIIASLLSLVAPKKDPPPAEKAKRK